MCGTVALKRQERTAFHIQESADPKVALIKSLGLRGYWCCPLLAGDRLVGTLSFGSRSRDQFEDDELDFLRTICGYVTVADERLRLVREMRLGDQQKDEFLAMLGHELRNPLAPLQNAVEILKLSGPKDQRVAMVRDLIGRQVHHLVRLVDDLLDISRIMRGKIGLPGMDGYEVGQRLRQQPGLAGVIVVAMTGYGQEADRRRSAQAGFHSHLIKPVEPAALQTLLSEFNRPCR